MMHPDEVFSSEEIGSLFHPNTPITSIRRAICNLKKEGIIEVVGKKNGQFNRPIFTYQYIGDER